MYSHTYIPTDPAAAAACMDRIATALSSRPVLFKETYTLSHHDDSAWIQISPLGSIGAREPEMERLRMLSQDLDIDLISLSGQTNAGACVYSHFSKGRLLRHLSACETWSEIIGEPQPWEAELFQRFSFVYEVGTESPYSESSHAALAGHFGLPGFSVPFSEREGYWTLSRKLELQPLPAPEPPPLPAVATPPPLAKPFSSKASGFSFYAPFSLMVLGFPAYYLIQQIPFESTRAGALAISCMAADLVLLIAFICGFVSLRRIPPEAGKVRIRSISGMALSAFLLLLSLPLLLALIASWGFSLQ